MRYYLTSLLFFGLILSGQAQSNRIQLTHNEAKKQVAVTVDGKPFTAYIYPDQPF